MKFRVIGTLNENIAIGCSSENTIHTWRWTDHFLHKPDENMDNDVYYVCIEFLTFLFYWLYDAANGIATGPGSPPIQNITQIQKYRYTYKPWDQVVRRSSDFPMFECQEGYWKCIKRKKTFSFSFFYFLQLRMKCKPGSKQKIFKRRCKFFPHWMKQLWKERFSFNIIYPSTCIEVVIK